MKFKSKLYNFVGGDRGVWVKFISSGGMKSENVCALALALVLALDLLKSRRRES